MEIRIDGSHRFISEFVIGGIFINKSASCCYCKCCTCHERQYGAHFHCFLTWRTFLEPLPQAFCVSAYIADKKNTTFVLNRRDIVIFSIATPTATTSTSIVPTASGNNVKTTFQFPVSTGHINFFSSGGETREPRSSRHPPPSGLV